jgi:hypothetical protein
MYVFYFTLSLIIKDPYQPIAPSTAISKAVKTKEANKVMTTRRQCQANVMAVSKSNLEMKTNKTSKEC